METTCIVCDGKIEKYFIKKFEYWSVYLHENQYHLGRVRVVLNRHGPEEIVELDNKEWDELKTVIDRVSKVLKSLYEYDLLNYTILQNEDRGHLHIQLIPRYVDTRVVHGEEFKDEIFGKFPFPVAKKDFDEKLILKIKDDIKKEL